MKKENTIKKRCSKCRTYKVLSLFGKDVYKKDGLRCKCKDCVNIESALYKKTKNGLSANIYSKQRSSSRKRNHPNPSYTLSELRDWLNNQLNWDIYFNNWIESKCIKSLIPSIDRKDDYSPYRLDNLNPITTWGEHVKKSGKDRKNGINNKYSKAVKGTHIKTGEIVVFHSGKEASRKMNIDNSDISKSCRGILNRAGNYKWENHYTDGNKVFKTIPLTSFRS